MLKRRVIFSTALIAILFMFSACGDNPNTEIVGKWIPTSAKINGANVDYSTLDLDDDHFSFMFNENGKCSMTLAGITEEGTYTFNNTSIDIITPNDEIKLNYSSNTITLYLDYDNNNSMQMSFIRDIKD